MSRAAWAMRRSAPIRFRIRLTALRLPITETMSTSSPSSRMEAGRPSPNLTWARTAIRQSVVNGHPSGNGLPVPNNQFASVNSAVYVAPMAAGLTISNGWPDAGRGQLLQRLDHGVYRRPEHLAETMGSRSGVSATSCQGTLQGTELDLRPGKAASSPEPGTPGRRVSFLGCAHRQKWTCSNRYTCRAFATAKSTW